jgi:AAT family amino acid transporter
VCVLFGMLVNPDTRVSLFVGSGLLLAVSLVYKMFNLGRHHQPALAAVERD